MKETTKDNLKMVTILLVIVFLLPLAIARIFFLYQDIYPYSFRDARILRAIHLQMEHGEVDLSAVTPFEWDTVYYLNDIPMEDYVDSMQVRIHVNLNSLRRVRVGKFDLPMGHCFIFVKDGKLVADLMMPTNFDWNIPTEPGLDKWNYYEYAALSNKEARFVPDETGQLHLAEDAA